MFPQGIKQRRARIDRERPIFSVDPQSESDG
jgi:hypothetical protein